MTGLAELIDRERAAIERAWNAGLSAKPSPASTAPLFALLTELTTALRAGALVSGGATATTSLPALDRLRDCILGLAEAAGATVSVAEVRILNAFVARAMRDDDLLGSVTDAIPLLVSFVTADERYGLVNKSYEEWFGQPREALLGRTIREVIGEQAYAQLGPFVRRGIAGERFDFEQHAVPYRFGGTRDVKVSFVPLRKGEVVTGYVAVLADITKQRHDEAERQSLARQRTEILESIGDAFFAIDAGWRITLVNRNFELLTTTRREDVVGKVLWEVFPDAAEPTGSYWIEYQRCMTERVPVRFRARRATVEAWVDVRAYPTANGEVAVFIGDISAEMRAHEALERQALFEQQLIGIVSHDLRNPLNVVVMASDLLLGGNALDDGAVRTVRRVRGAAERATRMVRDLLDFTQARLGGGIGIQRTETDLHDLVRTTMDEIEATHPARTMVVRSEGDGSGQWDPDRLTQVVQNLVTNALAYSPADSTVTVETEGGADRVTLRVHNRGAPIPAEKVSSLFEPMQRAVEKSEAAERSIGLGLYIVKQIVAAHGGDVRVCSSEADGTTFEVALPRVGASASPGPRALSPRG